MTDDELLPNLTVLTTVSIMLDFVEEPGNAQGGGCSMTAHTHNNHI